MYEVAKLDCVYVSEKVFLSMSDVTNPQGIMAVIEKEKNEEIKIDFSQDNYFPSLHRIMYRLQD